MSGAAGLLLRTRVSGGSGVCAGPVLFGGPWLASLVSGGIFRSWECLPVVPGVFMSGWTLKAFTRDGIGTTFGAVLVAVLFWCPLRGLALPGGGVASRLGRALLSRVYSAALSDKMTNRCQWFL